MANFAEFFKANNIESDQVNRKEAKAFLEALRGGESK